MPYDDAELRRHIQAMREMLSPAAQTDILRAVGVTMGVAAEAVIPEYPAPSGKPLPRVYTRTGKGGAVYLSKFKTAKQQGWFFWALSNGKLNIPYRRTGHLQNSITSAVIDATPARVTVAVGTNDAKAPWVIDERRQARYHQGTWWTLQPTIRKAAPDIHRAAAQTLIAEVKGRIRR